MSNSTAEENSHSWQAVLLGIAEVKLPLQRMPQDVRLSLTQRSYQAILSPVEDTSMESQFKGIGIVDNFYSLQEVTFIVGVTECRVLSNKEVILQHRSGDIIAAEIASGQATRVVYIARCASFGRASVVLQLYTESEAWDLKNLLQSFTRNDKPQTKSSGLTHQGGLLPQIRDGRMSWGRGMNKMLTSVLIGIQNSPFLNQPLTSNEDIEDAAVSTFQDSPNQTDEDDDSEEDEESEFNSQENTPTTYDSLDSPIDVPSSAIEAEILFLVEAEKNYLENLRSLELDRQWLSIYASRELKEALAQLFRQVTDLVKLHTHIYSELQSAKGDVKTIATVFWRYREKYQVYVYFVENISTVDRLLKYHSAFLNDNKPMLSEKLRRPRMRLNFYSLTLESLYKKVNKHDKVHLQAAMDIFKLFLKEADKSLLLSAVIGSPFELSQCGEVIFHSDLLLKKGVDLPRRRYHVIFLRDVFIMTKGDRETYQYVESFRTDQIQLLHKSRGLYFTLEVKNTIRSQVCHFTYKAKNIRLQQQWIEKLELMKPYVTKSATEFIDENKQNQKKISLKASQSLGIKTSNRFQLSENESNEEKFIRKGAIRKRLAEVNIEKLENSSVSIEDPITLSIKPHFGLPLTVWCIFEELEMFYRYDNVMAQGSTDTFKVIKHHLIRSEQKFITQINRLLGHILQDIVNPPEQLQIHLRRMYEFHSQKLLPNLEKSETFDQFLDAFINHADEFYKIYSHFLADRCNMDRSLNQTGVNNPFVYPITHFLHYWSSILKAKNLAKVKLVQEVTEIFRDCITTGNLILLKYNVSGVPLPLEHLTPVLQYNRMKVKASGWVRPSCHVLLFPEVMLLLEPNLPKYDFSELIRLDSVGLEPDNNVYSFQIYVRTGLTTLRKYVFKTRSGQVKKSWVNEIREILKKQAHWLKKEQQKRVSPCIKDTLLLETSL